MLFFITAANTNQFMKKKVSLTSRRKIHRIKLRLIRIDKSGCQLTVQVTCGRVPLRMIVDTGASQTAFDTGRMAELLDKKTFLKSENYSSGLGTNTMESHLVTIPELEIGTLSIKKLTVVLIDLSHVNQSYAQIGMPHIDGVIGGDILKKFRAIIDYEKKELKFRK